jgi:hypothetical protein
MEKNNLTLSLLTIQHASENYALEGRHDLGNVVASLNHAAYGLLYEDVLGDINRVSEQAMNLITGRAEIGNEVVLCDEVASLCSRIIHSLNELTQ